MIFPSTLILKESRQPTAISLYRRKLGGRIPISGLPPKGNLRANRLGVKSHSIAHQFSAASFKPKFSLRRREPPTFIKATDAAGSVWINKEYSDSASKYAYQSVRRTHFKISTTRLQRFIECPSSQKRFQHHQYSNVARLKFAADLSPESV